MAARKAVAWQRLARLPSRNWHGLGETGKLVTRASGSPGSADRIPQRETSDETLDRRGGLRRPHHRGAGSRARVPRLASRRRGADRRPGRRPGGPAGPRQQVRAGDDRGAGAGPGRGLEEPRPPGHPALGALPRRPRARALPARRRARRGRVRDGALPVGGAAQGGAVRAPGLRGVGAGQPHAPLRRRRGVPELRDRPAGVLHAADAGHRLPDPARLRPAEAARAAPPPAGDGRKPRGEAAQRGRVGRAGPAAGALRGGRPPDRDPGRAGGRRPGPARLPAHLDDHRRAAPDERGRPGGQPGRAGHLRRADGGRPAGHPRPWPLRRRPPGGERREAGRRRRRRPRRGRGADRRAAAGRAAAARSRPPAGDGRGRGRHGTARRRPAHRPRAGGCRRPPPRQARRAGPCRRLGRGRRPRERPPREPVRPRRWRRRGRR